MAVTSDCGRPRAARPVRTDFRVTTVCSNPGVLAFVAIRGGPLLSLSPARRRHDTIQPEIHNQLAVMIGGVPDRERRQAQSRALARRVRRRARVRSPASRSASRAGVCERLAQIRHDFFFGLCGTRAAGPHPAGGSFFSISLKKAKLAQATCFTCSPNVRTSAKRRSSA